MSLPCFLFLWGAFFFPKRNLLTFVAVHVVLKGWKRTENVYERYPEELK